jgi:hypothetical protein
VPAQAQRNVKGDLFFRETGLRDRAGLNAAVAGIDYDSFQRQREYVPIQWLWLRNSWIRFAGFINSNHCSRLYWLRRCCLAGGNDRRPGGEIHRARNNQ